MTTLVAHPVAEGPQYAYRLGHREPLDRGAGGVAAMASAPPRPDEPRTVADARAQGYAVTHGELNPGAHGVAVPLPGWSAPAAATVVSYDPKEIERVRTPLLETAEEIGEAERVSVPEAFARLVDDAAIFPPGDAPLHDATAAYAARSGDARELVGTFVLQGHRPAAGPRLRRAALGRGDRRRRPARRPGRALRQARPGPGRRRDRPARPRRPGRQRAPASPPPPRELDVPLLVELPHVPSSGSWLAAADEVAASGLRLKFRTLDLPRARAARAWIDAALDRETPFKCTAGLHHAVRHTDADGESTASSTCSRPPPRCGTAARSTTRSRSSRSATPTPCPRDLAGARRWFTSFGSCSVTEPLDDLRQLGLLP